MELDDGMSVNDGLEVPQFENVADQIRYRFNWPAVMKMGTKASVPREGPKNCSILYRNYGQVTRWLGNCLSARMRPPAGIR